MKKYIIVQIPPKEPETPRARDDYQRCSACGEPVTLEELRANLNVCPRCDHHFPLTAGERVAQLSDPGSFKEVGAQVLPADPLGFFDVRSYSERVREAQKETGLTEALLGGVCTLEGRKIVLGVIDFRFLGGSMGSVVGQRFVELVRRASQESAPLVVVAASGGARMQEGILSLMQMAKTVVALDILAERSLPFVSILTHPTTGGVLASFATQADVIMAEPGAFLIFAGPRVIEQTTREKLPPEFGLAEAHFASGQIDMVVHRRDLRERLVHLLTLLKGGERLVLERTAEERKAAYWGGQAFAQAVARAKGIALAPREWLNSRDSGRDSEGPGKG